MRNNLKKKKNNISLSIYIISISRHLTHSSNFDSIASISFSPPLYISFTLVSPSPPFQSFFLSSSLSLSLSRIYVIIYIHILYTIIYIQRIFIRDLTTNVALKKEKKKKNKGKEENEDKLCTRIKKKKKIIIPILPLTYIRTYACIYTYWYICMCVNVCVYIYYIYMIFSFCRHDRSHENCRYRI